MSYVNQPRIRRHMEQKKTPYTNEPLDTRAWRQTFPLVEPEVITDQYGVMAEEDREDIDSDDVKLEENEEEITWAPLRPRRRWQTDRNSSPHAQKRLKF